MVILHVERGREPKTSVLRSHTSWTPPSRGPHPGLSPAPGLPGSARGAGSKVRHGRSSGGQGEAGTGPARAWPGVPGGLRGEGTRGVQGAPVACCWGRPSRRAARQGPRHRLLSCLCRSRPRRFWLLPLLPLFQLLHSFFIIFSKGSPRCLATRDGGTTLPAEGCAYSQRGPKCTSCHAKDGFRRDGSFSFPCSVACFDLAFKKQDKEKAIQITPEDLNRV